MREGLDHLPLRKRRELDRVVRILFDEFEDAVKGKLAPERKNGRILKLILFGSFARGDWVHNLKIGGYRSDFDLLVVVNHEQLTDLHDYWDRAEEHLLRELTVTKHLRTEVNFIVHSLQDVNDQLSRGRYFFSDIARDGIALYEAPGFPLASPEPLSPEVAKAGAQAYFDHWFPDADYCRKLAEYAIADGKRNHAAFNLHQAVERLYHCTLLTLTLYTPKSHRLKFLRSQCERLDARLIAAWPRDSRFARRCFEKLRRAYIEARYSRNYVITVDELAWLVARIAELQGMVRTTCMERLARDAEAIAKEQHPR